MIERMNPALSGVTPSAIRRFSALAKETPGCMALTLGEPDFDTPAPVVAAAETALERGETHYIANNGREDLREAISAYERERHGLHYAPDEVIVTVGATQALFLALFGILEPGDEVVVPTPAYPLYAEAAKLCHATPVFLDTAASAFQIEPDALAAVITPRTKAIVLNSPNNPTGAVLGLPSLQAVHDAIIGRGIFAVCDDVYRELTYGGRPHSLAESEDLRSQVLVAQSFSKPWAMTGWRMGYLLGDRKVVQRLALAHQFMVSSTPAPFQRACVEALDTDPSPMVETYRARRTYVLERLEAMGLPVVPPQGAFYVFPSVAEFPMGSEEFCTRLIREGGLALTPGSCFGAEGYVRLSYCYSNEDLREGLDRLERFISSIRQ